MHPFRKIILAFEDLVEVPIEPDAVREWIVQNGYCDGFIVHYVDCDPRAFDGLYIERQGGPVVHHPAPYAPPEIYREIFVNKNLPEERRRLAEVKEALHVLDAAGQRCANLDVINTMTTFAATRLKFAPDDGMFSDIIAFPRALALLFPLETRRLLKPKFDEGKLTLAEIAEFLKLPEAYVETVMSDRWLDTYDTLLNYGADLYPGGDEEEDE